MNPGDKVFLVVKSANGDSSVQEIFPTQAEVETDYPDPWMWKDPVVKETLPTLTLRMTARLGKSIVQKNV